MSSFFGDMGDNEFTCVPVHVPDHHDHHGNDCRDRSGGDRHDRRASDHGRDQTGDSHRDRSGDKRRDRSSCSSRPLRNSNIPAPSSHRRNIHSPMHIPDRGTEECRLHFRCLLRLSTGPHRPCWFQALNRRPELPPQVPIYLCSSYIPPSLRTLPNQLTSPESLALAASCCAVHIEYKHGVRARLRFAHEINS